MKSQKYELLKGDYDFCLGELKLHKQIIEQQREEIAALKNEKKYWIDSHNHRQKAIDALKGIALYHDDSNVDDLIVIAKRALKDLV